MEEIYITHFVNPHLFWFKIENLESKREEVNRLERTLKNLAPKYRKTTYQSYKCGDLVTLHYIPWDNYVRASVAEVWQTEKTCKYIVWLLDHGFPVYTTENELQPLPTEFRYRIGNVQRGGIANILPIEKDRDLMKQRVKQWTERTYREMHRLLSGSYFISMDIKNKMGKHVWCDLRIESTNRKNCMATNFLEQHNLGEIIESDEFQKLCVDLKTLKQNPWEKLNKTSNYVKNEKVDSQYDVAQKALISESFEAKQASQLKVHDWLERNFKQGWSDPLPANDVKNKTGELVVNELNNDMKKLFLPPSWYKPANVINKFLTKLPPMPDIRAFDMSKEEAFIIENIKKKDNKLVASKQDNKKDLTPAQTIGKILHEKASSSFASKSSNLISPWCNLDKKNEPYVSPFHDEDMLPTSSTLPQEKMIFLPAGYDVTQLVKYRNPNHWHQAKSIRDVKMTFKNNKQNLVMREHHKGLKQTNENFKNDTNMLQHQESKNDHNELYLMLKNNLTPQRTKQYEFDEESGNASDVMLIPQKQVRKQHWCKLTSKLTKINLCDNSDWSNFYVQLASPENISKYDELIEYLYMQCDQFIPVRESELIVGVNYVVKYENFYYRAILQSTWDNKGMQIYRFFFVDNSFVYVIVGDDNIRDYIFQTSRLIIDFMPFQAIHCSLVGLDQNSCKKINFNVDANAKLYAFACLMDKSKMKNVEINSYKIALFECEDGDDDDENGLPKCGILLNTAFIKTKLAGCDEATLFYLDTDFGLQEKPITRSIAQRFLVSTTNY